MANPRAENRETPLATASRPRSAKKLFLGWLLATFGAILLIPSLLLAVGAFLPRLAYLGNLGTGLFATIPGQFVQLSMIGSLFAWSAVRLGVCRFGRLLIGLALCSFVSGIIILVIHTVIGFEAGVRVNPLEAFLFKPLSSAQPDITLTYTQDLGQNIKIDLYLPAKSLNSAPVMVYIHGGGWYTGNRAEQAANLRWFADHGYLVMSPDYTLSTPQRSTWMIAGQQVACAFAWIEGHATEYGGDATRMFADGGSAGGQLVLSYAFAANTNNNLAACDGKIARVKAVAADVPAVDPISFYDNPDPLEGAWARTMVSQYLGGTPIQYPDRAAYVSSKTYISADAPPALIILKNDDHLVPIQGALEFVERSHQAGRSPRVLRIPLAEHWSSFNFHSVADQIVRQMTVRFFCEHGGVCNSAQ